MNEFLLNVWQKLMIMHFVAKINGNAVLLEQGFVEYVAKIHGNALCGKNQWSLSFALTKFQCKYGKN